MKRILFIALLVTMTLGTCTGCKSTLTSSEPTLTPSKPALTSDERVYALTLADQLTVTGNAVVELGKLYSETKSIAWTPQENTEWADKVELQLILMADAYDKAIELNPPESMAEIHLKYIEAMSHFNEVIIIIVNDTGSFKNVTDKVTKELTIATQLVHETGQLLHEFRQTRK